jgi:multidrug efflux pump subunit AcrA (membrane-fusion protein)
MPVVGNVDMPEAHGIAIPVTAFTDDQHDSVMVVGADDTVQTKKVTETIDDGKTSIVSGLTSGTRVIADGQTSVGDGQKVAVR